MRKSDWALVFLIVGMVGFASYFIVNAIMPVDSDNPVSVPTAAKINTAVDEPAETVFNDNAINPTVRSSIGDQSNKQPFKNMKAN